MRMLSDAAAFAIRNNPRSEENPKSEIRNPKQTAIKKNKTHETLKGGAGFNLKLKIQN